MVCQEMWLSRGTGLCAAAIAAIAGAAGLCRADESVVLQGRGLALLPTAAELQPAELPAAAVVEPEKSWLDGWAGSVELGLNGSEGNTERLSFRGGFEAVRKVELMETKFRTSYSYATDGGEATENRARAELRNDWLFKDSPWRVFALGSFDYDEFQDWDMRLSGFGGVGYEFIKNDRTLLLGRVGAGVSKEIGGSRNELIPEALFGGDFEHKLTERQKISASVDVYPELTRVGPYRAVGRAAWEILVDPEVKMTLKLGIEDRYDSTPGAGFKRNDLDYFAVLVWAF